MNRYLAINIEGKIGQLTVRKTSSFTKETVQYTDSKEITTMFPSIVSTYQDVRIIYITKTNNNGPVKSLTKLGHTHI